jgi:SH3-like domain-containing protein
MAATVAAVAERRPPGRGTGLISVAKSWFGQGMREPSCRSTALETACRAVVAGALAALVLVGATDLSAQGTPAPAGASGLPVPRFVSLKSDRVNLRQGPGTEYPTAWVFRRAGLPVEVVKEFESWRQVRDAEGTTGWVLGSMLSGRRTAVILPWEVKVGQGQQTMAVLRDDDSARAGEVAQVEAGVLASIISCDGKWCRVSVGGFRGYIEQVKLWGAYKDEVIK